MKLSPALAPALGLIKGKRKIISLGASVLFALGTVWYISHLKGNIEELEQNAALRVSQVEQCQSVNDENVAAIAVLEGANASLVKAVQVTSEARSEAAAAARERNRLADARIANTISEMEKLRNANPSCDQLAKIDMGAVCPLVVDRMRDAANAADSQD